jgi:hypothetical protein
MSERALFHYKKKKKKSLQTLKEPVKGKRVQKALFSFTVAVASH